MNGNELAPERVIVDDPTFVGWRRPGGWTIVNLGRCRGCGAAIAWARTFGDRTAPLNRDGSNHFATCPQADRFRRSRRQP